MGSNVNAGHREPWNKGKIVGQKAPFKVKDIWALRVRLQMESRVRELALFDLGIDSKLRGCDLVSLKVRDICHGDQVASRAVVTQHKTQRPVQFEITSPTRACGLADCCVDHGRVLRGDVLSRVLDESNFRPRGQRTSGMDFSVVSEQSAFWFGAWLSRFGRCHWNRRGRTTPRSHVSWEQTQSLDEHCLPRVYR
jgi:hypothetical protein